MTLLVPCSFFTERNNNKNKVQVHQLFPSCIRAQCTAVMEQKGWLLPVILKVHSEAGPFSSLSLSSKSVLILPEHLNATDQNTAAHVAGVFVRPTGKVSGRSPEGPSLDHQTVLLTEGDLTILQLYEREKDLASAIRRYRGSLTRGTDALRGGFSNCPELGDSIQLLNREDKKLGEKISCRTEKWKTPQWY